MRRTMAGAVIGLALAYAAVAYATDCRPWCEAAAYEGQGRGEATALERGDIPASVAARFGIVFPENGG